MHHLVRCAHNAVLQQDAEQCTQPFTSDFAHHLVTTHWNSSQVLYRFLDDNGNVIDSITFAQFMWRSVRNATHLINEHNLALGDRVLLLCDPGSDFVYAFFAAIFAGLIAVPSYPPWDERAFEKLFKISTDCTPTAVIISDEYYQQILPDLEEIERAIQLDYKLKWIPLSQFATSTAVDSTPSAATVSSSSSSSTNHHPSSHRSQQFLSDLQVLHLNRWDKINKDTDAFLQYTSGSTGSPKGVRVSHKNILAHTNIILKAWEYNIHDSSTSWLPPYHDMQLLGTIMCSAGFLMTSTIMSPLTFLKNPFLWLKTISKYKSTGSGGPNFAYELCVAKITDEQVKQLDLSSWGIAYCGAEAVKQETLERFTKKFAPCGFKPSAYYPCYGLAEATLLVTGGVRGKSALSITVDADAYLRGEVKICSQDAPNASTMVSSGFSNSNVQHVEIVDIRTKQILRDPYTIGEIWIRRNDASPVGYWRQEKKSKETFYAKTATIDDSHNEYTITGDLGFFGPNRSLFISGRSKDLIIIRGRNIYPPDVEEDIHPLSALLRKGCAACFSVDGGSTEEMVFVSEIKTKAPQVQLDQLARKIQQKIMRKTGVIPKEIVFIEAKTIPKTTSGKVRRFECRQWYLEDKLSVLHRVSLQNSAPKSSTKYEPSATEHVGELKERRSTDQSRSSFLSIQHIQLMIIEKLKVKTGLSDIDPSTPFMDLGLDSVKSVELMSELSGSLKRELSPTTIFQYPTIDKLSKYLFETRNKSFFSEEKKTEYSFSNEKEPIAVIGMACRFPDAENYNEFWDNICKGKNSIHSTDYLVDERANRFSKHFRAGFLSDVYSFDAPYFGISAREAQAMDPQQRVVLELSAEALLDAGALPSSESLTGVFLGATNFDFSHMSFAYAKQQDRYLNTGSSGSIISNRVSYHFDFRGPSLTIDTACSSSLVAIHEACKSLHNGECSTALAGGVNIILAENVTDNLKPFLSPDAQCKAFDDSANGYVRGEGAGILVLKPLSQALRDGNQIHGVIKASLVAQDGKSNGITAPSQEAQQSLIQRVYSENQIDLNDVGYVEAHGTGTRLGDPIEAHALSGAFSTRASPLRMGSVKTNIGHLEAAAGIAGVIKALLSMKHKEIPPTLHFDTPNSLIDFSKLGLDVVAKRTAWESTYRSCGVSSFGFGGTLAHIVVEEAPSGLITPESLTPILDRDVSILISAHSRESLPLQVNMFAQWLQNTTFSLQDVSYSTLVKRSHHKYRVAFIGKTREEFVATMLHFTDTSASPDVIVHRAQNSNDLCFVFPGQGPDLSSQCKQYLQYSVFTSSLQTSSELVQKEFQLNIDFEKNISTGEWNTDDCIENQLVRVATQVALVDLWRFFGIEPTVVCGQSLGEVSAAYCAGFLTLKDTFSIVVHRARALNQLRNCGGLMIARASADTVQRLLKDTSSDAVVASHNSRTSVTIAGSHPGLETLALKFSENDIPFKLLDINIPYHSPIVNRVVDEMLSVKIDVRDPHSPQSAFFSSVNGMQMTAKESRNAQHWAKNMVQPVLFHQCLTNVHNATKCQAFVEIAGREIFARMIKETIPNDCFVTACAFTTADNDELRFLSHLACQGITGIQWSRVRGFAPSTERLIPLPTYKWTHDSNHIPSFLSNAPVQRPTFAPQVIHLISSCGNRPFPTEDAQEHIANQKSLSEVCEAIILRTMRQLGWDFAPGEELKVASLRKTLGIGKQHERLFVHLLRSTLAKHGIVSHQNDLIRVLTIIPDTIHDLPTSSNIPMSQLFDTLDQSPETLLLSRSSSALPDVLRGHISSLQVLFPNGSLETAETLYESSVSSRAFNQRVSDFVREVLANCGTDRVNLLEIGGGTAGLTSHIVGSETQDQIAEYMFTDISRLFTMHAQQKFVNLPFMRYAQLDIERSPLEQNFEQKYDIVLAANVLHATRDLKQTLSNIQQLLSENGILILLEVTRPSLFLDLTFGLTEGWWRFQDVDLRSSYPLLAADQWIDLMSSTGYRDAQNLTKHCPLPFQSIIVAQSSGKVMHSFSAPRSEAPQRSVSSVQITKVLEKISDNPTSDELIVFIQTIVAHTLMMNPNDVDPSEKLTNLGMDSLTALELKNIVQKKLQVELSLASFDEDASVIHIAQLIHGRAARSEGSHDSKNTMSSESMDEHISSLLSEYEDDIPTTPPAILAMGIGEAPFMYQQSEMMAMCQEFYRDKVTNPEDLNTIQAIFNGSDIETRRSVIDFYKLDANDMVQSFQKRNDIYEQEAIKLAEKSATEALKNWGGDRKNITHIVSVSTTGEQIPGIDFLLVDRLGLSENVERVAVNLMGCFGALPGLKTAVALARLSKKNRVLLVSTELCSPHIESEPTKENFVGAAIFADGSGAAIIGCGPFHDFEQPKYQILKTQSRAVPKSTDKMGWKVTDEGWKLTLSKEIPALIHDAMGMVADRLLGSVHRESVDWALHPGGKAILLATESALGITSEQTKESWNVMRKYGNMSSSTIMHVLYQFCHSKKSEDRKKLLTAVVFGPGLTIEAGLLRKVG